MTCGRGRRWRLLIRGGDESLTMTAIEDEEVEVIRSMMRREMKENKVTES